MLNYLTFMSSKSIKGEVAESYLSNKKYIHYFKTYSHDRTDLRQNIEKYWVGKNHSNMGVGGPVSIDWSNRQISIDFPDLSRKDIYCISLEFSKSSDHYNILVEQDLTYYVNYSNVKDETKFQRIEKVLKNYINYYLTETDFEYIQRQQKWFQDKPYQQIDGKTPEEAVSILKSLGW